LDQIYWVEGQGEERPNVGLGEKKVVCQKIAQKLMYDSYHKLETKEKLRCCRSDRIEE
jgi:hypothetical protein